MIIICILATIMFIISAVMSFIGYTTAYLKAAFLLAAGSISTFASLVFLIDFVLITVYEFMINMDLFHKLQTS